MRFGGSVARRLYKVKQGGKTLNSLDSTKKHEKTIRGTAQPVFYGWWIVAGAFVNLFFAVGMIFYGFPVFYPALVASLGFSHAQTTQGFLIGFLVIGPPFGLFSGHLIDRFGARLVILLGIGLIGLPLIAMGFVRHFWEYEVICVLEVLGYVLAGPISNQVLITQWFCARRGTAMGMAYLGLGLGGVASPLIINNLLHSFGWRTAIEIIGAAELLILYPIGILITRSSPSDLGLEPDGVSTEKGVDARPRAAAARWAFLKVLRSRNFWLITAGSGLVIGAMNAVIQNFIFFLEGHGYSSTQASRFLSVLLAMSLGGRVVAGLLVDRTKKKKNAMALCYCLLGAAIPLLYLGSIPAMVVMFAAIFGFAMGADYMLIPLVTVECFGVESLGKILALIVMGYSIGQWEGPWIAGRIYDSLHNYNPAWALMTLAAIAGSCMIYLLPGPRRLLVRGKPRA
jgi:MFS family permease